MEDKALMLFREVAKSFNSLMSQSVTEVFSVLWQHFATCFLQSRHTIENALPNYWVYIQPNKWSWWLLELSAGPLPSGLDHPGFSHRSRPQAIAVLWLCSDANKFLISQVKEIYNDINVRMTPTYKTYLQRHDSDFFRKTHGLVHRTANYLLSRQLLKYQRQLRGRRRTCGTLETSGVMDVCEKKGGKTHVVCKMMTLKWVAKCSKGFAVRCLKWLWVWQDFLLEPSQDVFFGCSNAVPKL